MLFNIWFSKVFANEWRCYICSAFSHLLRTCSVIPNGTRGGKLVVIFGLCEISCKSCLRFYHKIYLSGKLHVTLFLSMPSCVRVVISRPFHWLSWCCHQMETFSELLAICAGNSPVAGEFPTQRPATRSFDVFFDLRLNKRLSKPWGWWFETPSRPIWRHSNVILIYAYAILMKNFVVRSLTS